MNFYVAFVQRHVAALVFGDFAGFARVKMILARGAVHEFAGFGFAEALGRSFVGFDFGHEVLISLLGFAWTVFILTAPAWW